MHSGKRSSEGSDRLTADQWRSICQAAVSASFYDAWLFMTLAWNLLSRAGTTSKICFSWLSWNMDHIDIDIPCHKGDPTGELGQTTKSLYANPLDPSVCSFTALGVNILSRNFVSNRGLVFEMLSTELKFNDWLRQTASEGSALKQHITAHSARKGAATHLSSQCGLAVLPIWMRAGWNLGGVIPVYIRVENGGDQLCGRGVCGLPPNSPELAILPARFNRLEDGIRWHDIVADYDFYPQSFKLVIPYLVAQVIHHSDWLSVHLCPHHPLRTSRFWTSGLYVSLRSSILPPCNMHCSVTNMSATGVPPHIQVMHEMRVNYQEIKKVTTVMEAEISRRQSDGPPTLRAIEGLLQGFLSQAIPQPPSVTDSYVQNEIQICVQKYQTFTWDGDTQLCRPVPADWEWPSK